MEGKVKGDRSYKNTPFEPEKWWKEDIVPEGAETFSAFVSRTLKATNYHLSLYQNILFVAHGGIIMAILTAIGQSPYAELIIRLYFILFLLHLGKPIGMLISLINTFIIIIYNQF